MKKEIGYGEMVFNTKRVNEQKDGTMETKTGMQKRYYKVKRNNYRTQVVRINELQLETLKKTPGVICMQDAVVKYFTGYKQQLYNKYMEKAMLREEALKRKSPAEKATLWQRIKAFIKRLLSVKKAPQPEVKS